MMIPDFNLTTLLFHLAYFSFAVVFCPQAFLNPLLVIGSRLKKLVGMYPDNF